MDIEMRSFVLGAFVGVGLMLMLQIIFVLLRPWIYAQTCAAPVSLGHMIGMKLRNSPPRLLIDAYVILKKIPVEVSIQYVEVVYIQNKLSADHAEKLAQLVLEQLKKQPADSSI